MWGVIEADGALNRLGGKALNLQRLADAGLPVPPFVTLPADEYRTFVADARLAGLIAAAVVRGPVAQASATIDAAFAAATPTPEQRQRLLALAGPLADAPVAVRSSATAEDLPDLSFAGQLDSFLDVRGPDALIEAIVACWASAWTERAIAYRVRNGVPHEGIAVAVVVQRFVPADASGVLFTANPLTGRRGETVVDATFGLGEALVQGRVTPDAFVLDTATGAVTHRSLAGAEPTLTADHLATLVALGRRVATLFGSPQDIEWVRVGDELGLVQSRPITSLYPLPADDPRAVWFSFGAFQGMLAPITPLGRGLLRHLLAGAARAFGRTLDPENNAILDVAGERLWVRVDGALRDPVGRRVAHHMLPLVDPSVARILDALALEPAFAPTRRTPAVALGLGLAAFLGRIAPRLPATVQRPASARHHLDVEVERLLRDLTRSVDAARSATDPRVRLERLVLATEKFADTAMGTLLPTFGPIMGPGLLATRRLRELAAKTGLPDAEALALHALRALPGNVTTAMDFALWDASRLIRDDPAAWGFVADTTPAEAARLYRLRHLPKAALDAVDTFLAAYGMRGVAEIDLGSPRWRDDPTPVFAMLQSYLSADADHPSPRDAHREGQRVAGRAVRQLLERSTPRDRREIRSLVHRIRATMGARETPKFALIRGFGLIRDALAAEAPLLVDAGVLASADDLFFLHLAELRRAYTTPGLADAVAARRAARAREARRRAIPSVLVGDGRAFFPGASADPDALGGAGVSPGVAEGPVRVVLDPASDQVAPGEILVCPGTDPAWTPLFQNAAGLVTEVGGLMTHGSVVAREYGIPAVVGVRDATIRLVTGQRVRIDGTSGAVELL